MAKYSKKVVKKICQLIEADSYTIAEICSATNINVDTFYDWFKKKPEFSEAVTRARERFDDIIVKEAKNSLRKKVNGYEVQEMHTVFTDSKEIGPDGKSKPKIKEKKIVTKHFQPDTDAIKFVLTNKAKNEYKNIQTNEHTGKDGSSLDLTLLSKEERDALLKIGQKVLNGTGQ